MKSLQNKLRECPLYEGFYKNAGGTIAHPSTKEELKREIRTRLDRGQTNLNDIDTSKITNMNSLFSDFSKYDLSNIDISKWDVSNVKYMNTMFYGCTSFNSDLSKWDVSNVEYMNSMFYGCKNFNCDLSGWDISKVEYMNGMFLNSGIKNRPKWYEDFNS